MWTRTITTRTAWSNTALRATRSCFHARIDDTTSRLRLASAAVAAPRFCRCTHTTPAATSTAASAAATSGVPDSPVPVPPVPSNGESTDIERHPNGESANAASAASTLAQLPRRFSGSSGSHGGSNSHSRSSHESRWERMWRLASPHASEAGSALVLLLQFVGFLHVMRTNVVDIMSCAGPSMMPTMAEGGDVLVVAKSNAVAALFARFGSRSAVTLQDTHSSGATAADSVRVAGASPLRRTWDVAEWLAPVEMTYAPGDVVVAASPNNPRQRVCKRVVALAGDEVTVDSSALMPWWSLATVRRREIVPEGHVWLQGDNLANSTDSRSYGPVPLAMVQGRVVWKLYPFREWGPVQPTLEFARDAVRSLKDEPHGLLDDTDGAPRHSLDDVLARWSAATEQASRGSSDAYDKSHSGDTNAISTDAKPASEMSIAEVLRARQREKPDATVPVVTPWRHRLPEPDIHTERQER